MRLNGQSDIAIAVLVTCARAPPGAMRDRGGRQGGIALAAQAREILLGNVLR